MRRSGKEAEIRGCRLRERAMEIRPGKGCTRAAVQRRFEGNRLAREFQIQAYEQVLPAMAPAEHARVRSNQIRSEKSNRPRQGGIAA